MHTRVLQRQGQQLQLTPQLAQSLKVLAMNVMELDAYLEECLMTNPLLEECEQHPDELDSVPDESTGCRDDEPPYTPYMGGIGYTAGGMEEGDREQAVRSEESTADKLLRQIRQQPMCSRERRIAEAIIFSLDDDGYFREPMEEFARSLSTEPAVVEGVLTRIVHRLDPPGIGARDLLECLLLQLDETDEVDRCARKILLYHRDHIDDADALLAGRLGCDEALVAKARLRLRRLDPYPGRGMYETGYSYVYPEIVFREVNGEIQVEVPDSFRHRVRINDRWKGMRWHGSERDFMERCMKEARWLLYALDQRRDTLLKVGRCLARRQADFLKCGPFGLKPLTLQDVAEEVGMHESTISRVTHGKYADTPLGLIPLRSFFSTGLPTRGGGVISVYRVQQRVKALIDSEPPNRPISDQEIAERLQAEGIQIARRTVAKYRESLRIPSSSKRKALMRKASGVSTRSLRGWL